MGVEEGRIGVDGDFGADLGLFADDHRLEDYQSPQAGQLFCRYESLATSLILSFSKVNFLKTGSNWHKACPILFTLCVLGTVNSGLESTEDREMELGSRKKEILSLDERK
jgi:hypothetical protein